MSVKLSSSGGCGGAERRPRWETMRATAATMINVLKVLCILWQRSLIVEGKSQLAIYFPKRF